MISATAAPWFRGERPRGAGRESVAPLRASRHGRVSPAALAGVRSSHLRLPMARIRRLSWTQQT